VYLEFLQFFQLRGVEFVIPIEISIEILYLSFHSFLLLDQLIEVGFRALFDRPFGGGDRAVDPFVGVGADHVQLLIFHLF
jgi:hypothetical protein